MCRRRPSSPPIGAWFRRCAGRLRFGRRASLLGDERMWLGLALLCFVFGSLVIPSREKGEKGRRARKGEWSASNVAIGERKGEGGNVPSTGKSSNSSSSPRARCFCSGFCCSLGVDCSGSATLGSVVDAILGERVMMRRAFSLALEVELRWRCYRTEFENGDGPAVLWIAARMTEMRKRGRWLRPCRGYRWLLLLLLLMQGLARD